MARRKLKLNDGKAEIIVIRGSLRNVSVANFGVMSFDVTQLVSCESVKNLGVVHDSSLRFRSHIDSIVKTCNIHICNMYMIKDFVKGKNLVTLVHSLIVSNVDYCNSLFIGLPNVILKKVQSGLSWIEQQGLHSTCPPGFQPPPHLLSCTGCLLRQELNLKYVSLLLNLWSLISLPILGNLCLFPPMNPPWVYEVQMTLTVCMSLELLERGNLPIALCLTLPRFYIMNCQLQLNWSTLNALKSHLKAFLFSFAYDQSGLTVTRNMHCEFLVFLLIVFFSFRFSQALVNFGLSKEWVLMANKIQILLLLLLLL